MKITRKDDWNFCRISSLIKAMASRIIIFSQNVYINFDVASTKDEVVKLFLSCVKISISGDGYNKCQVLNFGGTGLYWKNMPPNGLQIQSRSQSSLETAGDWMTVSPGKTVSGDLTGLLKTKITFLLLLEI